MKEEKSFTTHIDGGVYGDSWQDQTQVANQILHAALKDELPSAVDTPPDDPNLVYVAEARFAAPVLPVRTAGRAARVLFIAESDQVFVTESETATRYQQLSEYFDEVHVLVLTTGTMRPATRFGTNAWYYTCPRGTVLTAARHAIDTCSELFIFNDFFRPDILVAENPLHAGSIALTLADYFDRPVQIHCRRQYFTQGSDGRYAVSWWQRTLALWRLRRSDGVRTHTQELATYLRKKLPRVDVAALPHFYNFEALRTSTPAFELHTRYPDFKLILLTIAPLTADSSLQDTLAAVRTTLLANKIGLIVLGDGQARSFYAERVKLLGIDTKVVFVHDDTDLVSYLRGADVLIEPAVTDRSEETVLKSIAAGLPAIVTETDLRLDLLQDGVSGYLCAAHDTQCLSQKLIAFLNNLGLRTKIRQNLSLVASERLHEDQASYYQHYAASIVAVLGTSETRETTAVATPETELVTPTVS